MVIFCTYFKVSFDSLENVCIMPCWIKGSLELTSDTFSFPKGKSSGGGKPAFRLSEWFLKSRVEGLS